MKRLFRNVAILMCLILLAPSVLTCLPSVQSVTSAEAAEKKAKLYETSGTTGVQSSPEYLYVLNMKTKAKYSYTSSNKKIATVDKYGTITGISAGSATITVKETYKKKTTKVGSYKVKVVNATLSVTKDETGLFNNYYPPITHKNNKANYTFTSSDSKIVTTGANGTLIGLTEGTANVTITEKYKGNTRDLGTFALTIIPSTINADTTTIQIGNNSQNAAYDLIYLDNRPYNDDVIYSYESSNSSVASVSRIDTDYGYSYDSINGISAGSATITVYETYNGNKRTVGTVTVNVIDIPLTNLEFDSYYYDETISMPSTTYYLGDTYNNVSYSLVKTPDNATTKITYSSSDESIVKVDADGNVTLVAAGTATITATGGTFTAKIQVTVVSYDGF